jgi:hypothetical protein
MILMPNSAALTAANVQQLQPVFESCERLRHLVSMVGAERNISQAHQLWKYLVGYKFIRDSVFSTDSSSCQRTEHRSLHAMRLRAQKRLSTETGTFINSKFYGR